MELGVRKRDETMEVGQRDAPLLALKMEEGSHEPRSVADSRSQQENSTAIAQLQGTEFCPRRE